MRAGITIGNCFFIPDCNLPLIIKGEVSLEFDVISKPKNVGLSTET